MKINPSILSVALYLKFFVTSPSKKAPPYGGAFLLVPRARISRRSALSTRLALTGNLPVSRETLP
ncbi:hypothetical protein KKE28_03000, partial [Patescibacteria group bacterium]|nr:hypothetical protein [Patescibacteria group bacterium]